MVMILGSNLRPKSLEINTQTLANYMAEGELFAARNIVNSNFRKLLTGFAIELGREQELLWLLSEQHDISTTTNLIEEWERALGIPDTCFTNTVSLDQRRLQCGIKFAMMNIVTMEDWLTLASALGYNIKISYSTGLMTLPFILPFILTDFRTAKFTMLITFLDLAKPENILPFVLPFVLGAKDTNLLKCIFSHLKPANVQILYKYGKIIEKKLLLEDDTYLLLEDDTYLLLE